MNIKRPNFGHPLNNIKFLPIGDIEIQSPNNIPFTNNEAPNNKAPNNEDKLSVLRKQYLELYQKYLDAQDKEQVKLKYNLYLIN